MVRVFLCNDRDYNNLGGSVPQETSIRPLFTFDTTHHALWAEEIDASRPVNANPKVTLQEWLLSQGRPAPSYEIVQRTGPDHAPVFVVEARGDFATVRGRGRSRQDAEKDAAQAALAQEGIA